MPLESPPHTLLDLLRSTLSLLEYYDGLDMPHQPVMDELTACMRRAIAEISAVVEARNGSGGRRPVASAVPEALQQPLDENEALEQETG